MLTDRVLARPLERQYPHFLGAVVLQQVQKQTGQMQERTIIDGQQRLTTFKADPHHSRCLRSHECSDCPRLGIHHALSHD
jgi:hypothetical protein